MEEGFRLWANPSSPHAEGRKARHLLEDARERIKRALEWSGELIFTSGASEALWIALNRAKAKRRIVSAVEHDAVFRAAPDATVIPIPAFGAEPDFTALAEALGEGGAIFALQSLNSETGTQMLDARSEHSHDLARRVREAGGVVLADCSQSAGKLPLPDADMIVVSAHKFGGPIGVGALLVCDFALLDPVGGHERGYRQGTENLPGALGMAAALEAGGLESWATSEGERLDFRQAVWAAGEAIALGPQSSHIIAVAHPTMSAQSLLIRLDAMGLAVSAGSACSSGTLKKSRVLDAFGVPDDVAARTIRVSLGWSTTPQELERFAAAWESLA
ncbi:aminotransferase class V-fold PLP-dependent enzyme [Erythrobacter sp. CCH5-A1]|jgi:cysteine desulfurase|uniref:cysteine desulfurase family protein n=1 Tax=Erythrobacter sp. CCH5-A1 TaxID=1768792 RepID=UPI000ADEFBD1